MCPGFGVDFSGFLYFDLPTDWLNVVPFVLAHLILYHHLEHRFPGTGILPYWLL
jgi:hypothetical protein